MARGRFRETAMVEPEPYYEPGEPQGFLMPLIFGLVIGLGGLAVWLGLPEFPGAVRNFYETNVLTNVPEDYQPYTIYAVIGVILVLFLLMRGALLRVPLILGVLVGALLWVPFGNHMMALAPQIEENMPALRGGIDGMLADYPTLQSLRDLAETNIAVPGTATQVAGEES